MKLRALLPLAARFSAIAVAGIVTVMVAAQYVHIIARNVAYALELRDVQRDITQLEGKRAGQQRDIARLSDPQGAIPEIHDRLHLVGDHEAIIYLKHHVPVSDP